MNSKFNVWENEEVKTLFKFVEIKKSEGMPLIKIFDEFAKCTKRCQKSVRNYYYLEIKNLNQNKERCKELGINLKKHYAKRSSHFTKEQTQDIVKRINTLVENGYSVRKACLTLADGNIEKMLRLQNKYRTILKQKKDQTIIYDDAVNIEQEIKRSNIIKMPLKRNIMTDDDIKALVMGIIKLVKKQAFEIAKESFEQELNNANEKLKSTVADIIVKKAKIEKMQDKIKILEQEININKEKRIIDRVGYLQKNKATALIKSFIGSKKREQTLENDFVEV